MEPAVTHSNIYAAQTGTACISSLIHPQIAQEIHIKLKISRTAQILRPLIVRATIYVHLRNGPNSRIPIHALHPPLITATPSNIRTASRSNACSSTMDGG